MHIVNGKIEDEIAGVISTPLSLINSIFNRGENQMTAKTISKICSVEGCESTHKVVVGMCSKHYQRFNRHGSVNITHRRRLEGETLVDRFWSGVEKTASDLDCWEWNNYRTSKGYGAISDGHKPIRSHILSWTIANGRNPKGIICHTCDNPPCCNPNHLIEGTHKSNAEDRVSRNRQARGETIGNSKVKDADVLAIRERRATGETIKKIADDFNIAGTTAGYIISRKTWRHI